MKEDIINRIVNETINEMFRGSSRGVLNEDDTVYTRRAKQDLAKTFQNFYDRNKANQDFVSKWARNIGVSLDKGEEREKYRKEMLNKHGSYEEALRQLSPEVKRAITAMNLLKNPNLPKEKRDAIRAEFGGTAGLQRYRDILDSLSLTPAYDQTRAKDAGIINAPFNTRYKAIGDDGKLYFTGEKPSKEAGKPARYSKKGKLISPEVPEKPADTVTGYDYKKLDLTDVPSESIISYFADGTRAEKYGKLVDMANAGDGEAFATLKNLYFKAEFDKILNGKFGYNFNIPGAMYTYGNAKLPNDTLVINFTSAHKCPAWSECLVGYACYARGSEHNYPGLLKKNNNLHLMWQAALEDDELMDAMERVIKMYLINPENIARALLDNEKTKNKWLRILTNGKTEFNQINALTNSQMEMPKDAILPVSSAEKKENENKSLLGSILENMELEAPQKRIKEPAGAKANLGSYLYDKNWGEVFSKQDIAVIKATDGALRARFIRLNEEGDFIVQKLLDKFNEFAGEFKLLGISTAAYTCRNLNFSGIRNIIINASTIHVGTKGEEDGDVSEVIARRFFAVSEELYNSLEDTYVPTKKKFEYIPPIEPEEEEVGENGKKKKKKKKKVDNSPIVPLHNVNGKPTVKYALKPYTLDDNTTPVTFNDKYDKNGPTIKRRLYYKCPCGRLGYGEGVGAKPIKMDCYMCRMCYEPKNQNTGEIYVLVKVHGENIDSFDIDKANTERGINGKMATYKEARNIFGNRLCEETQYAENKAHEIIAENCEKSVQNHITEMIENQNAAMQMENKNFSNFMNRMTIAENKRKKEIID